MFFVFLYTEIFINCILLFREEEGKDLLSKRTMDFKVSYLDAGFATSYFDSDTNSSNSSSGGTTAASGGGPKLNHRRYKTQLRDFLSSCRTKRKPLANELYGDTSGFAAAAAAGYPAAAATMYSSGTIPGYPGSADSLYMQQNLTAPAYQSLYPGVDNRYLAATDYFTAAAGYRSLSSYYPDYATHAAALGNGYLDVTGSSRIHSLTAYDGKLSDADKLYGSSAAAAAYMSAAGGDPRLCGSLRLPTPTHGGGDSKHGKDSKDHLTMLGESGKVMVKEEGLTNTEYLLPSHHTAASTLADQLSVSSAYSLDHLGGGGPNTAAAAVLYMCPPATMSHHVTSNHHSGSSHHHHPPQSDSPNSNYDPRSGHVHSPGLRLASAIAAGGNSPSPVGGGGPHSHSGETGTSPSCMDNCSTTLQTSSSSSYCTLSLSELCGGSHDHVVGSGQGGHTNTTVSLQAQEVTS